VRISICSGKKLKEDDFETDIIEVLRESHDYIAEQLTGLSRDDFSEIYLFFDYDTHQTNMGKEDDYPRYAFEKV